MKLQLDQADADVRTLNDRLYFASKRASESHQDFMNKYNEKAAMIKNKHEQMVKRKNEWF